MKALVYVPQPDLAGHIQVHEVSNEIINFVGKIIEYDRIHNLINRLICYDRGNLSNQYIIIKELDNLLKSCDVLIIVFTRYYFKTFRTIAIVDTTRNVKARGDFRGEIIETEHFRIEYYSTSGTFRIFEIFEKKEEREKEKEEKSSKPIRIELSSVYESHGRRIEEYDVNGNKIYIVYGVTCEEDVKKIVYMILRYGSGLEPSREEKIDNITVLRWRPRTVAYSRENDRLYLIIFRRYVSKRSLPNLFKALTISF